MRLGTSEKKLSGDPPHQLPSDSACPPSSHLPGEQPTFFAHVIKAAGITRKELQYDLRLSKTYVDLIMAGDKLDPLTRARDVCAALHGRGRMDLVMAVLAHIAGGDDFDGRILTAAQVDAIRELAKAVEQK